MIVSAIDILIFLRTVFLRNVFDISLLFPRDMNTRKTKWGALEEVERLKIRYPRYSSTKCPDFPEMNYVDVFKALAQIEKDMIIFRQSLVK